MNDDGGSRAILVRAASFAWLAMLAFDFLLHGGLLAKWYAEPSPFLLPAGESFARIPWGYASSLVLAILLSWILARLGVSQSGSGARVGLWLGSAIWGSLALGLYSITTAPAGLLAGWFVGQSIELGIAGSFAGAALGGARTRSLALRVLALIVSCAILTILLQSTGLAPATTNR